MGTPVHPTDHVGCVKSVLSDGETLTFYFEYPVKSLENLMIHGLDAAIKKMATEVLTREANRLVSQRLTALIESMLAEPTRNEWIKEYANKYISENMASRIQQTIDRAIAKSLADLQHRILGRT